MGEEDANKQTDSSSNGEEGNQTDKDTDDKETTSKESTPEHKQEGNESATEREGNKDSETQTEENGNADKDGEGKSSAQDKPKRKVSGPTKVKVIRVPKAKVESTTAAAVTHKKITKKVAPVIKGKQKTHINVSAQAADKEIRSFGRSVMKRFKIF